MNQINPALPAHGSTAWDTPLVSALQALIAQGNTSDTAITALPATYVHFDGTHLTQAGTVVPISGGSAYSAGNGLALSGSTFSVSPKSTGSGLIADGTGIYVDPTLVDTHYAVNSTTATPGTATTYTHNLGSLDVTVTVVEVSSGSDVYPDISRPSTNTITLTFAAAVSAGQYRVIVRR